MSLYDALKTSSRGRTRDTMGGTIGGYIDAVALSLRLVTLEKSYRSQGSDNEGVGLLRMTWINVHAATREQRPFFNEKLIYIVISDIQGPESAKK
jgi:hypothetical protein